MKKQNVVAVTFEKIQSFLFHVIMEHQQENQSDSETLSGIIGASRTISEGFFEQLGVSGENGIFQGHIGEVLLRCSGVCIFTTDLDKEESMKRLDGLFAKYYKGHQGKLFLKYICLEREKLENQEEKLKVIGEAKRQLKRRVCLNDIISRQQKLLFQFQAAPEKKRFSVSDNQADKKYEVFTANINELRHEPAEKNVQEGAFKSSETYFRTVIIKADLDGMGALFQNIKRYDVYKKISDILYEEISLEELERQTRKIQRYSPQFKLYPLYVAGDDIMFAVHVSGLREGIDICENMLKCVNRKIGEIAELKESGVEKLCTLSIGVELSENHEPIRYYYERVQRQLEEAKREEAAAAAIGAETVYSKICVNECVFHHYKNEQKSNETKEAKDKEKTPIRKEQRNWGHFLHMLKLVQQTEREGLKTRYFLHELLKKAMPAGLPQNEIADSNAILYHFLPKYLNSSNQILREGELMIIKQLLEQFMIKSGKQWKMRFGETQYKKLCKYVQLLLVFSDERFDIDKSTANSQTTGLNKEACEYLRKDFNRVLRYLYDQSLLRKLMGQCNNEEEAEKLRDIFVKRASYIKPGNAGGKKEQVQVYQTINISGSLFHRMKRHVSDIVKCGVLLETVNGKTQEEYNARNEQRNELEKPPEGLPFEKEKFIGIVKKTGLWSEDYLDSLLLLFRYKDSFISFKKRYPKRTSI